MSTEKIIDKIKKLMAHSDSAKSIGSLAEAELFAQKATELLMEYNLNLADIIMAGGDETDKFATWIYSENIKYQDNQSGNRWKFNLCKVLSKYNLCKVMFSQYNKTFQIYGQKDNVDTVIWLFHFMSTALLRIAQESHTNLSEYQKKYVHNRYAYLKDFLNGAVVGVQQKLEEQQVKSQHASAINSLMVVNGKDLDKYAAKVWPNSTTFNTKAVKVNTATYEKGVQAGRGLSVGGKLTTEKAIEKKLLNR